MQADPPSGSSKTTAESHTTSTPERHKFEPEILIVPKFELEREERQSDLKLRERIANWLLWFYGGTLVGIGFFGLFEGAGGTHLGENFKWLIGLLTTQTAMLSLVIRGLFKVPKTKD